MSDAATLRTTTQQNLEAALAHFLANTRIWSQRRMYGEFEVRLRFVNGVAVQWEASQTEIHKPAVEDPE